MKISCPFCQSVFIIRWGKRRRKCKQCERTFRGQKAGRKKKKKAIEMYVLDRSTHRRVGMRTGQSHVNSQYHLKKELTTLPLLLSVTKNFLFR